MCYENTDTESDCSVEEETEGREDPYEKYDALSGNKPCHSLSRIYSWHEDGHEEETAEPRGEKPESSVEIVE